MNKNYPLIFAVLLLSAALILGGCGVQDGPADTDSPSNVSDTTVPDASDSVSDSVSDSEPADTVSDVPELTPVIEKICNMYLRFCGNSSGVNVIWDDITLQDSVEQAKAELYKAQAKSLSGGEKNG